jgi:hypothetical protein
MLCNVTFHVEVGLTLQLLAGPQYSNAAQLLHTAPPLPQAVLAVPVWQAPDAQQPVAHVLLSQLAGLLHVPP